MTDPWEILLPYDAMFTDSVVICGVRPEGRSFRSLFTACVFPPEKEDPFAETDADTKVERLTLLVRKKGEHGWTRRTPPQTGDGVKTADGRNYRVSRVAETVNWYELEAKSC